MFKLESYITPIILSYVDKYIRDFKLEDSQVSLWGGDASFLNLDLRLEVLEQELQSPFSFVSGHIQQLSIHVPWTKLTSEPITITINTIECVLKLRGANNPTSEATSSQYKPALKRPHTARQDLEAPPNYIQFLVNKIVSNIRIICKNLILKYVEEDIVLSMNVKYLNFESANGKWEPAYTDISPSEVILRKIIGLNDLTICLDKRNAVGKIDNYLEPVLYRCSMTMHLLKIYHSATANRASTTRLDIYCNNMEFSMTEQQVPMLLRLCLLLYALQQKQLRPDGDLQSDSTNNLAEASAAQEQSDSWSGWAWSMVSYIWPYQLDPDFDEQLLSQSGHTVHIGFFVDSLSLVFKVSEMSGDKSFYTQKKTRYISLLQLKLQGIYCEVFKNGVEWFNSACGVSEMILLPMGHCSCGENDAQDSNLTFLKIGSQGSSHKADSLFDAEAIENKGKCRNYNTNWDFHMQTITESSLLDRTSAVAFDYAYQLEIPDDAASDILSEIGSNLEFSNLPEKSCMRLCVGPAKIFCCSSLWHRCNSLQVAASAYDYAPYGTPKPDVPLHELLPPSTDDFEALNQFIPTRTTRITFFAPELQLQMPDHCYFIPNKLNLCQKPKKIASESLSSNLGLPRISIECKLFDINIVNPMYVNRLIHTTCQLPDPPREMFDACFSQIDVKVMGISSKLILNSGCQTNIIVPFNCALNMKRILLPKYWINPDISHSEYTFEAESFTLIGTKAKLLVMAQVLDKILKIDYPEIQRSRKTSLLIDAARDFGLPYLELYLENIRYKNVTTASTVSIDTSLGSIKAFILESEQNKATSSKDLQQVMFLSAPEPKKEQKKVQTVAPLFAATLQYPLDPEEQIHPTVFVFNLQDIKICVDPLFCKWLFYCPIDLGTDVIIFERSNSKMRMFSETSGSILETSTKRMNPQIESVHSSSDRELVTIPQPISKIPKEENVDIQDKIYNSFKIWYPVWKSMLFNGNMSECTIYFPMNSLSALGMQGIGEAVDQAIKSESLDMMILHLPSVSIHSSQKQNVSEYLKMLPVKLPGTIWALDKTSFPWTMSTSEINCCTIKNNCKQEFLKPVTLSATVALSTKSFPSKSDSSSTKSLDVDCLAICVHIDMTPVLFSASESQLYILASVLYSLCEGVSNFFCKKEEIFPKIETLPVIPGGSTSRSPTIIKENSPESMSDDKTALTDLPMADQIEKSDNVKLTVWLQWTVTRFTVDLLANPCGSKQFKLVIDVEDIVNSLDFQSVYLKFKSKIGSITVQHFEWCNNAWKPGKFSGFVLKQREDINVVKERHEDNGLINVTLTRASCQHTHTLWGAVQKRSKSVKLVDSSQSRYITEVVISVQPIDFIISLDILKNFNLLIVPPQGISTNSIETKSPFHFLNNQTLPLAYLDCQDIRVIIPSSLPNASQDVYIVEFSKICLNSTAVNPICRKPLRVDIYQQAAKARILNIPGSEVEDRQYQFDMLGISMETGKWQDLERILFGSAERGLSENPALQWNNLKQGQHSIDPILNLKKIVDKFDITLVAAPAIIYHENTVCGASLEINFVSDLFINLTLDQVKLASALIHEYMEFVHCLTTKTEYIKIKYPYSRFQKTDDLLVGPDIADSGIDSSDLRSVLSNKSKLKGTVSTPLEPAPSSSKFTNFSYYNCVIPIDLLFTAGKISLILYQVISEGNVKNKKQGKKKEKQPVEQNDSKDYEASEEESTDEETENTASFNPLLYICLSQPNIYYTLEQMSKQLQISCFDISTKITDTYLPITRQPSENDFPINLIDTRAGMPDPNTGILRPFLTVKYIEDLGKLPNLDVDLSKPIKFVFSSLNYRQVMTIKNKLFENIILSKNKPEANSQSYRQILDNLNTTNAINLRVTQIVFDVKSDEGREATLTVEGLSNHLYLHNRPEKLHNFIKFQSISLSVSFNGVSKLVLNPWKVSADVVLFWDSWQSSDSLPQIQLVVDSDCIILDINPPQMKCIEGLLKEFGDVLVIKSVNTKHINTVASDKDQHYKDDLRAGAFQLVNANSAKLPLPYQIILYNDEMPTMSWRYPQPRALTKVRVFPVPYMSDDENYQILCHLEYWSECQSTFIPYTHFYLSETEIIYLNLPQSDPLKAVACIWRVTMRDTQNNEVKLSPQALASCLRIDSYFNKSIIPTLTAKIHIEEITINLSTVLDINDETPRPLCLEKYVPMPSSLPCYQNFLNVSWTNVHLYVAKWIEKSSVEVTSKFQTSILDYAFLIQQPLIESFLFKAELNISQKNSFRFSSNRIQIVFGPNIAHTMAVSGQLWSTYSYSSPKHTKLVILTRYVICNNTNASLIIGQDGTNECLLLKPGSFHLYAWRSQKANRKLKLVIEDVNLTWSKPFTIDDDCTKGVKLKFQNFTAVVTVTSLSVTQKQITISGQLIVSNMLREPLFLKIVEDVNENKDAAFTNAPVHLLKEKTIAPSILIHSKKKYFLRLRFSEADLAWTGDIPLKEHRTGAQPWLVKVPLQERGNFWSVWCRIVVEEKDGFKRYLAMLWPLFTVRSNLPVPFKVHVYTPNLNRSHVATVTGKGQLEQLYCPGTVDHSHQLTFELNNEISSSNPYVPLNYSLVDNNFFFKKREDIDVILKALENCGEVKWPYLDDSLNDIVWITDQQPLTTIQVRYQNACPYSSALVVELSPWCLMFNTLGCVIALRVNGSELCRIPQHGLVAPPKLDENFNIGVSSGNVWYYSNSLQLAKSDWSQTFYMPKIAGTLPLEGCITTTLHCGVKICLMSISSSFSNEMRLLKVSSSHVLSNHVPAQLEVICFAVPASSDQVLETLPLDYSFTLAPKLDKSCTGIPLIQWYTPNSTRLDLNDEYALYIAFSIKPNLGWSCPIRVDKTFTRKSLSVITETSSVPLVLISQESKGQNFLSLHYDNCPQTYIENHCGLTLYCAQYSKEDEIVPENPHIKWFNKIEAGRGVYYTMPTICDTFPEVQEGLLENIVFSCDSKDDNYNWSGAINISTDLEQFLRIPFCGDVKVIVKNTAYTTLITVESVSQVEISAKDIRVRLSMQELDDYSEIQSVSSTETVIQPQNFPTPQIYKNIFVPTLSVNKEVDVHGFIDSFSILFTSDLENGEFYEVANFTCDYIGLRAEQSEILNIKFYISDIQLDNQLYNRESFDFPVVFIRQEPKNREIIKILAQSPSDLFDTCSVGALLSTEMTVETWKDSFKNTQVTGVKSIKIITNPLSCFIEDLFITSLINYLNKINPTTVVIWDDKEKYVLNVKNNPLIVKIPEEIYWQSGLLARPLNIQYLNVETLSVLLSVHCSVKMYIALDQSPLQFGAFERKRLLTTPFRLGHSLTMHYLSGAIFGAGWVVSSLELLGSPSGLARAMSSGIRDFISLPYRGLIEGPWAFLIGVTHGSASLMKHLTAGTLQSVTKLASSVARNLDRLTLDEEHLKRAEEQRRQRPQGLTEGFMQGLTGFGISLLGAIGGIAHHPIRSMMSEGASPISLATGVGLGLVGIVTKPLSGAAEFLALTGQGLLQGAGWNNLPEARSQPTSILVENSSNAYFKYIWKILMSQMNLLFVTEAVTDRFEAVNLVLTKEALIIFDIKDDRVSRLLAYCEIDFTVTNDPTLVTIKILPQKPPLLNKGEDEDFIVELDPVNKVRIANYVKSTANFIQLPESEHSITAVTDLIDDASEVLNFYVNPQHRNYFYTVLTLAKQEDQNCKFPVL